MLPENRKKPVGMPSLELDQSGEGANMKVQLYMTYDRVVIEILIVMAAMMMMIMMIDSVVVQVLFPMLE